MAKWEIVGANRDNGEEKKIYVEAPSQQVATQIAAKRGLFTSSIRQVDDSLAELALAAKAPQPVFAPAVPEYREIVQGGSFLLAAGVVCYVVGILAAVGTVLLLAAAVAGVLSGKDSDRVNEPLFCASGVGAGITSILFFVLGAIIRMLASTALAIRDTAINSFRR